MSIATMRDYNTNSRNAIAGWTEDGLRPRNGTPKSSEGKIVLRSSTATR